MRCACGQPATSEVTTRDGKFLFCPVCCARWWHEFMARFG